MRNVLFVILFAFAPIVGLLGQNNTIFDENTVATIEIEMNPDSLEFMIDNLVNDRYMMALFIFTHGMQRDTVDSIGIRLRGNTSLAAQKKSFKISFNAFKADGEYQELRKLNLRGSHNDPTLMRERLFYHVWNETGMPERRSAFAELYINNDYRGVYTNIEEIDKRWLDRVYGNNDGNLYKCQWPANLANLGTDQNAYKAIINSGTTRAYDLKTNEAADDYSRLVTLITTLDQPVDASYPEKISQILNVESVIKAFALDVASGNWDDYFYNQNNYYLYDNPATGKFEFITLDTDNTFGVDWLNKDWATRNCLSWLPGSGQRPLATKLMAVPEYKQMFIQFLHLVTQNHTRPSVIFPYIDQVHSMLTPFAALDTYRSLDYGYTLNDFHNGITMSIDGHTPYGIKPFLEQRRNKTLEQLAGLVDASAPLLPVQEWHIWPNPVLETLYIDNPEQLSANIELFNTAGQSICILQEQRTARIAVPVAHLNAGVYFVRISTAHSVNCFEFLH